MRPSPDTSSEDSPIETPLERTRVLPRRGDLVGAVVGVAAAIPVYLFTPYTRVDIGLLAALAAVSIPAAGAALVIGAVTLLLHGGTAAIDLSLALGALTGIAVGRLVLREVARNDWSSRRALQRLLALVAAGAATAGLELLLDDAVEWTLGNWADRSVFVVIGIMLGAMAAWWPGTRRHATARFYGASLVCLTAALLGGTARFLTVQDDGLLRTTADTAAFGFLSTATDIVNVVNAKAGTSVAEEFSAERFPTLMQTLVFGYDTITSAHLVELTPDGPQVLSSLTSVGPDFEAAVNEWAALNGDELTTDLDIEGATYVDRQLFPSTETAPLPYLLYAVPIATDGSFEGTDRLMIVALSVRRLLNEGAAATDIYDDTAVLSLYSRDADGAVDFVWNTLDTWDPSSAGPVDRVAADERGVQATSSTLFNDSELDFVVRRGSDFGAPGSFRLLVFGAEIAIGSLLLGIVLLVSAQSGRRDQERTRREALLNAALEGADGWTAVVGAGDRVVMSNAGPHGVPIGTSIGATPLWADDDDTRTELARLLAGAHSGEPGSMQHVWSDPDDPSRAMRIFEVDVRPLPDPGLVYLQCIDVTENRDRAMRTAQSERMEAIGVLAGGLAHDFNNLLFITLGYLQMLQRQPLINSDQQASTYVSRAIEAVDRGAVVAKSLLSFARSQPLTPVPVNLHEFMSGLRPLVEQALGPAHQLRTSVEGDHLDVVVDTGRLSSSLLNIVFNSRDAMEKSGTVEIRIRAADVARTEGAEPERMIGISVEDTGKGIPQQVLARAFEPFFTTKRVGSGTGLGLSTVYSFAQQCGGWATIDSTEGVGTTVTVYLPPASAGTERETQPGRTLRKATRALVVDDEPALADLVSGWLEMFGMQAKAAYTPQTALQIAEEFQPQLLVSDANLSDPMDGLELARTLVQRDPALMVMFMTGFSDRIKALQKAGVATLAKPFSADDLYAALSSHLGERLAGSDSSEEAT